MTRIYSLSLKTGHEKLTTQFIQKWRSICYYYRNKGLLELAKKIGDNLFKIERYDVFETDLSKPITHIYPDIPISIRVLSNNEGDIDQLVEFWPTIYAPPQSSSEIIRKLIHQRLEAGEECLFARHGEKIVYMNWHGFQNTFLFNPQARQRGLHPDEALSYNTYCDIAYRRKKIHDTVIYEMCNILQNKGYKKLITYVLTNNQISSKSMSRIVAKQVQTQYCLTLLGYNFYLLSKRIA